MARRPRAGKPMSKEAASRAADRAEARARGEDPTPPPTPLEPFVVSTRSEPAKDDDFGWAAAEAEKKPYSKKGLPFATSAYNESFARIAKLLCERGATDLVLGEAFGVSDRTIERWRVRYPEFGAACHVGKGAYDEQIIRSVAQKAMGYSIEAEKIFHNQGEIVRATVIEHHPPDVAAAKFWLINRAGWRDKVETGLTNNAGDDVDMFSEEAKLATARKIAFMLTRAAHLPPTDLTPVATDDAED